MPENGARPLEGVRVVEMGSLLAGPFCGQLLADFGAEVIKVEPPGKDDPMRVWGRHRKDGRTLWWPIIARNKKSVTRNLREVEGQDLARRLLAEADVLVENFRPGTLERWGGRLAKAIGHPEWAEDEKFATHHARGKNMEELDAMISAWTRERSVEEVIVPLAGAGVPTGKVFTAQDMVEDPHYAAREDVVTVEDPEIGAFPMQNVIPRLSETPGEVLWTGPALGQHNEEVYGGLLKLDDERAGLRERGIF